MEKFKLHFKISNFPWSNCLWNLNFVQHSEAGDSEKNEAGASYYYGRCPADHQARWSSRIHLEPQSLRKSELR